VRSVPVDLSYRYHCHPSRSPKRVREGVLCGMLNFEKVYFSPAKSLRNKVYFAAGDSRLIFTRESRMLRAYLPSSGRPSVRPSVTLVICIKTVQTRITKSLLWTAPRSLVYCDKISCHWVQGFPSNEGVKEGYPLKKTSFCHYWLE